MTTPRHEAGAIVFLGAGFSRAFDYPTTKEFLANLKNASLNQQEKQLLQAFVETPGIEDIEHVLEIVDQVVECGIPLLKYLSHYPSVKMPF